MTKDEIKNIIDKGTHRADLRLARDLQDKLSFFVETYFSPDNVPYLQEYKEKIKRKINNKQSFNRFLRHLDFPLQINEFTEYLYIELSKIFEAQNANFDFNIDIEDVDVDFDLSFYEKKLWGKYKKAPNTLILLDVPEVQLTDYPIVSKIFIDIYSVIEFELKSTNSFEYLIFQNNKKLYFVNAEKIAIYEYNDNKIGELIKEVNHNYSFCPVFFISNEILNGNSNFVRSNKLVKSLTSLEDLQTINIFKKLLTPHAFYLFVEKFKNSIGCNFENATVKCEGGYLFSKDENRTPIIDSENQSQARCPECNEDIGIGNELKKSLSFINSGSSKINSNVLSFISPSTEILDYGDKFIKEFREIIAKNIIGTENSLNSKLNHNQDAYAYNTESKETVLINLKYNFEQVIKRIERHSLLIIYGDKFKGLSINLGTKFLFKTLTSLFEELSETEKYGLSEILEIKESIIDTKFKTNPKQKKRAKILLRFNPNIKDADLKFEKNLIPENQYYKQIYFSNFINWFETYKYELDNNNNNIDLIITDLEKEFENYLITNNIKVNKNEIIGT